MMRQFKRFGRLMLYALGLGLIAVGLFMTTAATLSLPLEHAQTQPSLAALFNADTAQ